MLWQTEMQKRSFGPGDTSPRPLLWIPVLFAMGRHGRLHRRSTRRLDEGQCGHLPAASIFVMFSGMFFFFFSGKKSWHRGAFTCVDCLSCLLSYWYTKYVLNHHIAIFTAWFFVELRVKIIPVSQSILFSELQNSWSEQGFGARQMNSPVLNIPSKEKNFWRWRALWLFFGRYQASLKGIPSIFELAEWLFSRSPQVGDPTFLDYFGVWKWALKFSKVFSFKWTISRVSSGFLGASYWLRRHPWRRCFWGVGDTRWSVAGLAMVHLPDSSFESPVKSLVIC